MGRKFIKSFYPRIKDWFSPVIIPIVETRNLTIPLAILALICLIFWKKNVPGLAEFGLNAFTEILGIILTVVFVDQLIRQQEIKRTLPLQAAVYEDIRLLTTRVIRFWEDAFRRAVPRPAPSELIQFWEAIYKKTISQSVPLTVEQLLSTETIDVIRMYLDLDSQPNVTPQRTWWEWLPEQEEDFRTRGERILQRHMGILDPQTYALIHQFVSGVDVSPSIRTMRKSDQELGYPRPQNLGSYWITNGEVLNTVVKLNEWCIEKKQFLEKQGMSGLLNPVFTLDSFDENPAPECMIDSNKFRQQALALQAYREQLTQ